jgi:aldehyde dehydrogenase (NAD+)
MFPHVYTTKWRENESRAFLKEEVFGPHVAILPFDDLEEAIGIYNDTDFGLSVAVCTNDYRKMRKVRDECDYGLGYVNLPCIGAESQLPFGGVKKSGYGGSSAAATFDAVVNKMTWTINHDQDIKMAQGLKA